MRPYFFTLLTILLALPVFACCTTGPLPVKPKSHCQLAEEYHEDLAVQAKAEGVDLSYKILMCEELSPEVVWMVIAVQEGDTDMRIATFFAFQDGKAIPVDAQVLFKVNKPEAVKPPTPGVLDL